MRSMACCWLSPSASTALMLLWMDRMASMHATTSPLSADPRSLNKPCTSSLTSRVPLQFASRTSKSDCRVPVQMLRSSSIAFISGISITFSNVERGTCIERFAMLLIVRTVPSSFEDPEKILPTAPRPRRERLLAGPSSSSLSESPASPVRNMTITFWSFAAMCRFSLSRLLLTLFFALAMVFSTNMAMIKLNRPKITKRVTSA
mmetsp:Transcript_116088/g.308783  ORF Transcript_116088/g.308783 Transcript_116088/m.308783 type:complete len:204 (+) Transcript_116088:315-926(+)